MKSVSPSLILRVCVIVASLLITTQSYTQANSLEFADANTTMIMDETVNGSVVGDDGSVSEWAWYPLTWRWWTIAQALCAVLGVIDNGIVIIIIFQRVEKNRSTDTLIGSLAIADLLTSVFLFPIPWAKRVPPTMLGTMYCKLLYPGFALWLCITASTLILMAICIERYIAVVHPLYFNRAFTKKKVSLVVAFCWLFSFAQCFYSLIIFYYDRKIGYCTSLGDDPIGRTVLACYAFAIRLAIPVLTMMITQALIIRSLQIQSKRFKTMGGSSSFHITARNNVIKMLLIVVLVYVITWMPNQIAYFLFNLGTIGPSYRGSPLHRSLTVFAFLNSCANPIIYTSHHTEFRRALKNLFTCVKPEIISALFEIKETNKPVSTTPNNGVERPPSA